MLLQVIKVLLNIKEGLKGQDVNASLLLSVLNPFYQLKPVLGVIIRLNNLCVAVQVLQPLQVDLVAFLFLLNHTASNKLINSLENSVVSHVMAIPLLDKVENLLNAERPVIAKNSNHIILCRCFFSELRQGKSKSHDKEV